MPSEALNSSSFIKGHPVRQIHYYFYIFLQAIVLSSHKLCSKLNKFKDFLTRKVQCMHHEFNSSKLKSFSDNLKKQEYSLQNIIHDRLGLLTLELEKSDLSINFVPS